MDRHGRSNNRPDLHSFDLKKAVLHQDGTTVCKPGRFKMEDAQKDMDDRYRRFTKAGIGGLKGFREVQNLANGKRGAEYGHCACL